MLPSFKYSITLLIFVTLFSASVVAQKPHADQSALLIDNFRSQGTLRTAGGTISALSKTIRTQFSPPADSSDGRPSEIAERYIRENSRSFGLDPSQSAIRMIRELRSPAGTHIHFRQIISGLPVYRSESVVTVDRQNRIAFIASGFRADITAPANRQSISAHQAIATARNYLNIKGKEFVAPEAEPVLFPSKTMGDRVSFCVRISTDNPRGDWELMVDAESGVILNVNNLLMYQEPADGSGYIWLPDPLRSAQTFYGSGFSDAGGSDEDSDSLNAQRIIVNLQDITYDNGFYLLQGPYVRLTDVELPADNEIRAVSADSFRFRRSEQEFEQVMVYYHIDRSYRYLSSLGFDIPGLYNFRADPHGLNGEDNSYYSPFGNFCAFGEGGVDDAEDAAVIWHEYAHAIQENIADMSYTGETAALQEGSSDYWAASFSRSVTEFAWQHVFLWDAGIRSENDNVGTFWAGRRCDLDVKYPQDYIEAPNYQYRNGQIWSSALMRIWSDLGKEVTDRLFLQAHYLWGSSPTLNEAAHAFIKADSILYNGVHVPQILDRFDYHGLVRRSEYFPQIVHIPLPDTENTTGPYRIEAQIIPARSPLDSAAMWLYYSNHDMTFSDSLPLTYTGFDQDFYADIPGVQLDTTYYYYLEVTDQNGNLTRDPHNAPQTFHQFRAGTDHLKPQIFHVHLPDQAVNRWPAQIEARITDNIGVAEVWVKYESTGQAEPDSFPLTLSQTADWYEGAFNLQSPGPGDSVKYQIIATDVSSQGNVAVFPETGYAGFKFIMGGGEIIYTLDSDDGAFTATGDWQWGVPQSGPYAAYSGDYVWATILDGNYHSRSAVDTLMLPQIDLSSFSHVTLSFRHWYNIEKYFDGGNVKISENGGQTWEIVNPVLGYDENISAGVQNPLAGEPVFSGVSGGWILEQFNLDRFAGQPITIAFFMGGDESTAYAGWYIDEIKISDRFINVSAPANLQVVDDRDIVVLQWEDVFAKRTTADEIQENSLKLQKLRTDSHQSEQTQNLYYNIYKRIVEPGAQFQKSDSTFVTQYTDSTVVAGTSYQYYVTAVADTFESLASDTATVTVQAVVSVAAGRSVPERFDLGNNYPNPFNPATTIRFQLPQNAAVRLDIFDVTGARVRTLVNEIRPAGYHTVSWDGRNLHGQAAGSGVYFYRLETAAWQKTRKMILIR